MLTFVKISIFALLRGFRAQDIEESPSKDLAPPILATDNHSHWAISFF